MFAFILGAVVTVAAIEHYIGFENCDIDAKK